MSKHEGRISKESDGRFYALIVRIDRDGEEHVIRGFKGFQYKTRENAEKAIAKYLRRMESQNESTD